MVSLLSSSDPMITRTLSVPPTLSLADLHTVIQVAFGWTNSHMHNFAATINASAPGIPRTLMQFESRGEDADDESEDDSSPFGKTENENKWSLKDVFEKKEWEVASHPLSIESRSPRHVEVRDGEVQMMYVYDMGDSWEHMIILLGRAPKRLHRVVGSGKIDAVIYLGGEGHPCAEDCGADPGWEELKEAFRKPRGDPELKKFAGRVSDSGEGRWTIDAAIDEGVPAHVLTAALYERFSSRGAADFADKLLSAMRYEFGGHIEKKA